MGTNYYLEPPDDYNDDEWNRQFHIGKSSAGWRFLFHRNFIVPPWDVVKDMLPPGQVYDEYGRAWPTTTFLQMITEKAVTGKSAREEYNPSDYYSNRFFDVAWHGDVWS